MYNVLKHIKQKIHKSHDVLKHIKHIPKTYSWIWNRWCRKDPWVSGWGTYRAPLWRTEGEEGFSEKSHLSVRELAEFEVPVNILWRCSSDNGIWSFTALGMARTERGLEIYQQRIRRLSKGEEAHPMKVVRDRGKKLRVNSKDVNIQGETVEKGTEKDIQGVRGETWESFLQKIKEAKLQWGIKSGVKWDD